MDYKKFFLRLKNKTYAFAGLAFSFFGITIISLVGLFVLLIISINFRLPFLAGLIFMISAFLFAGFCFILNTVSSIFGKGRSVLFGSISLYLNLMATFAFSMPDYFSGLGVQKWFSMSMMFFAFATGGGVALVSFEKFSKIIAAIIIALNASVFIPNNSLIRGLFSVVSGVGNVFSRKLNDMDQDLTPTPELIRQRYLDDYNKKKHELIEQSEKGLITAEEYARQLTLLEEKYRKLIMPKAEVNHGLEAAETTLFEASSSQMAISQDEDILSIQLWDSFGIKVEDLDENLRKQYDIPKTVKSGAVVVASQSKFLNSGDVLYEVFMGNYQIAKWPIKSKKHLLKVFKPALPWVPVNSGLEGQCFAINYFSYNTKASMALTYCYRSL